ncbi:MAG: M48 family metallopeptidase [Pseudoxanthomonas suwonensis]|nr:M48 family metallopeptidase [Pseudoxanthomonas suwonensis]
MRQDPFGRRQPTQQPRRGFRLNPRLLMLAAFALYGAYYYFSNRTVDPFTGEKVLIDRNLDAEQESAMGLQAYREILSQENVIAPNTPIAGEIRDIAQRLIAKIDEIEHALASERGLQPGDFASGFNWEVNVIQSEQANAFALPGGKMAVYTGLVPVAQNTDGMAVVMGHEIAHALMRHGAQRMARGRLEQIGQMAGAASGIDPQMQQVIYQAYGVSSALPYARGHESQADEVGLMLAAAACYDPREAVPLWERMGQLGGGRNPPEFASTHPSPATRIAHLQELMPKALEYRQRFCEQAN